MLIGRCQSIISPATNRITRRRAMTDDSRLYSRVYHAPQEPIEDSPRFRRRIVAYFREDFDKTPRSALAKTIFQELGVRVPFSGGVGDPYLWDNFFEKAELRDVLDSLTFCWRYWVAAQSRERAEKWRNRINRVLAEEGLAFFMNESGGIRRVVDEQFEQVRRGALAALDGCRYSNARDCFEEAHRHLAGVRPHYKASVRSMFECVEALVRLLIGGKKLDSRTVRSELVPLLNVNFAADHTAQLSIEKMGESLCDWIDSAHFYRHGQAQKGPVEPSDAYCVYVLTAGSGWARWLVELDEKISTQK